jgi:hypothetical protein
MESIEAIDINEVPIEVSTFTVTYVNYNTIRLSHIDYFDGFKLLKTIHLKQIMGYRKIVKKIVQTIDLPEKMIERLIIDYIGIRQFDYYSLYN